MDRGFSIAKFLFLLLAAVVCPGAQAYAAEDNVTAKSVNVTYRLIASGDKLSQVRCTNEEIYTASRADDEVVASEFYGEHVEILKASAPGAKPFYTSWEPEGMFHTGSKVCVLKVPLKRGKDAKVTFVTLTTWPEQFCAIPLSWPCDVKEVKVQVFVPAALAGRYSVVPFNFPEGMKLDKTSETNGDVCYTVTASDLPALKHEAGAPELSVSAPQLFVAGHFSGVDSLYTYLKSFTEDNVAPEASVDSLARIVTGHCNSDIEKIDSIAAWVRKNIRYLAIEHGEYALRHMPAADVLARRYGDCKGSANLIKEMLQASGLDGRLVWIGTRGDVPTQWTEMPSLHSGNHQIACAVLSDTIVYIDGTSSFAPDGYLPWAIRGREVIIENGDECIIDTVTQASRYPDTELVEGSFSVDGGNLTGSLSRRYSGNMRSSLALTYFGLDAAARKKLLERVLTYPKKNLAAPEAAFVMEGMSAPECEIVSGCVTDHGAVKVVGDKMYVDLRPIRAMGLDPVDMDKRKQGLAAKPASDYMARIALQIPDGYTLEQLPDPKRIENEWFEAEVKYSADGSRITASASFRPRSVDVPVAKLQEYNSAIKAVNRLSQSQIVLKYEN